MQEGQISAEADEAGIREKPHDPGEDEGRLRQFPAAPWRSTAEHRCEEGVDQPGELRVDRHGVEFREVPAQGAEVNDVPGHDPASLVHILKEVQNKKHVARLRTNSKILVVDPKTLLKLQLNHSGQNLLASKKNASL